MGEAEQLLRGRFELIEEIGEGGFARVYRARETTTGRKVALKVLKEGFQNDSEVLERFRREVFAVASINSPHVVGLKDFGISGNEFFIAMEFVEGPTLRDVITEHDWSADSVHTIIGQIAAALGAAHAQNIVHRDLKPENVMLVAGPQDTMVVKVLDFGLAKLAELERNLELAPLTRVGMCFGTPQYMSPELIYGKPVDRGVDIFALGVMAYEMIAGQRPWDGKQPHDVMISVVKTPFPPVSRVHPSLSRRVDALNRFFQRALAKRKEDRPVDAEALFRELSEAMYGERRPLVVPSAHETTAELSAIHMRLAVRNPRPDETQLDMDAAIDDSGDVPETRVDFRSLPPSLDGPTPGRGSTGETSLPGITRLSAVSLDGPTPPQETTKETLLRAGRLSAVWIPSMTSTPSLEEVPPPDSGEVERTIRQRPEDLLLADNESGPTHALPVKSAAGRPSWLVGALVAGLVLLMVAAAAIGFFIGRGRQ